MTKEYEFRGKLLKASDSFKTYEKGVMIYGGICKQGDKHYIVAHFNVFEVDEETVGQYTGLKDKNGVKIYEGDIIEHTISGNISVHEVYFDNEMLEFGLRYSGELFHCQFNDEFELIGNIHDNPELLNN